MSEVLAALREARASEEAAWAVMTDFVQADATTGAILATGRMQVRALPLLAERNGCLYLPVAGDAQTQFVDLATGRIASREPCPAVLEGLTLTGLPAPCTIRISNPGAVPSAYSWADPICALTFDHPGAYVVTVESARHLTGRFEVVV